MINTRLFIGKKEVDLDKDVQFTINKTFKNLSNPTDIINDWTKTIVLPFTANNNRIFGEIYNADRTVVGSLDENNIVGIYFDPSKKIDFVLTANGSMVMNGYMKMSSIEADKGYSINLFGQIGKVFSELKKVTPILTETITEDKYLFDPLKHDDGTTGFYMTKEEVYKSWNRIRRKNDADPLVSTIGFAPYSGYNSDFENDQIQLTTYPAGQKDMLSFKDILTKNNKYVESIYSPDAIVGNGLLPRQIGDYRSYCQYPYIFVDKLFEILKTKTAELTDYELILDDSWFDVENVYYNNVVMLLKQLEHNNTDQQTYAGFANYDVNNNVYWNDLHPDPRHTIDVNLDTIEDVVDNNMINVSEDHRTITIKYDLKFGLKLYPGIVKFLTIHPRTRLLIHVKFVDSVDNTIYDVDEFNIFGKTTTIDITKYTNAIQMDGWFDKKRDEDGSGNYRNDYIVDLVGNKTLKEYKYKHPVKIQVEMQFVGDMDLVAFYQTEDGQRIHEGFINSQEKLFPYISTSSIINYVVSKGDKRSFDKIYFNDLWNNDYSLFDQCIKYTKMFNLYWDLDDNNKTITVLPMYKYFSNTPEVEDWTDKIDFKKEYKIEPLIYDSKYYKLGYEDSETGIGQDYLKRHGSNFGDMSVNTKYNFNENTNMLIEGLKAPIIFTQTVLDWNNIYSQKVVYTNTQEPMVVLSDKDNNAVDMFGTFLLYRGLKYFNDDLRNTALSDDTQDMQDIQKYMYIETQSTGGGQVVDRYPYLDICYDYDGTSLGATFGTPKTRYDSSRDYTNFHPIYETIWSGFLDEYTNIQNHKMTAYAKLSLYDIVKFKHSRFVKIKNQLYLVNKIIDYSFDVMTKVELIKVFNVDNYRNIETPFIIPLYARSPQSLIYVEGKASPFFSLTVITNIGHFSRYNVMINYVESGCQVGIVRILKLDNNTYNIMFSHVEDQELDYHGYINIVDDDNETLLTVPFELNMSGEDDSTIEAPNFQFMDSVLTVNDLTSNLLLTFKTSLTIDQRNIQFQIKNGDGSLSIATFRQINPDQGIYAAVISQNDFNTNGGNGNILIYSSARLVGRIAWRINGQVVGPYINLTPEYAVIPNTQAGQIINFTMETNQNWSITNMNNINFITPSITEGTPGTYNFQIGVITGTQTIGRNGASVSFETEIGLQKDFVVQVINNVRN